VIVDATFLKRRHRDMFRAFAAQARVPFSIVDFTARDDILRERIAARFQMGQDASDADLAVLEHQIATHEPLQADELGSVFTVDASAAADQAGRSHAWAPLLQQLLCMPASECLSATSDQA
jgi:predicted kinase